MQFILGMISGEHSQPSILFLSILVLKSIFLVLPKRLVLVIRGSIMFVVIFKGCCILWKLYSFLYYFPPLSFYYFCYFSSKRGEIMCYLCLILECILLGIIVIYGDDNFFCYTKTSIYYHLWSYVYLKFVITASCFACYYTF